MMNEPLTVMELPSAPGIGGDLNVGGYAARHPGPCQHFNCPMQSRCKDWLLACKSFGTFINSGRLREPDLTTVSHARYRRIFERKD